MWELALGFAVLVSCLEAGTLVARVLPVPGSVLGMLLLFLLLQAHLLPAGLHRAVVRASHALLRHLLLLFIPVTVGVITLGARLAHLLPLLAAVVVGSTLLILVVTGMLAQAAAGREGA